MSQLKMVKYIIKLLIGLQKNMTELDIQGMLVSKYPESVIYGTVDRINKENQLGYNTCLKMVEEYTGVYKDMFQNDDHYLSFVLEAFDGSRSPIVVLEKFRLVREEYENSLV
jgi:hypothetical protein